MRRRRPTRGSRGRAPQKKKGIRAEDRADRGGRDKFEDQSEDERNPGAGGLSCCVPMKEQTGRSAGGRMT